MSCVRPFSMLPQPFWFGEAHARFIMRKEGENCADVYELKFNIVLCQDTCEPICSNLHGAKHY